MAFNIDASRWWFEIQRIDTQQMQSTTSRFRSPFLTIDRLAMHFPNVFLDDRASSFTFGGVINRDRDFTNIIIILNAPKAEAHIFATCYSPHSAACVNSRNHSRLSSRTLSPKPLSILSSPSCLSIRTNDRRSEVKLQPRATNFCNSLSCHIPLENAPCREWEWVAVPEREGATNVMLSVSMI